MTSNRGDSVGEEQIESSAGSAIGVGCGETVSVRDPRVDRASEVAGRVRDLFGGESLVEMSMWFGHCRKHEPTLEVVSVASMCSSPGHGGLHRLDPSVLDSDIDDPAIVQTRPRKE